MTKKEWSSLRTGTRVYKKHTDLKWDENGKCTSFERYLTGVVKRTNSNHSQALVDWGDNEIWYGRLGIELINPNPVDPNHPQY